MYTGSAKGPAFHTDVASDVALAPAEDAVYVVGDTDSVKTKFDWGLVAYSTSGKELWARRLDGPAHGQDDATSVAVSPTTGRIFVAGAQRHDGTASDFATAAYSPKGKLLWVRRIDGSAHKGDVANDVVVSANGGRVYSVGSVTSKRGGQDGEVVSYRPDGTQVWKRTYDGVGHPADDLLEGVLGPSGRHLYAVGATASDYLTICARRDGHLIWQAKYDGTGHGSDAATDHALAPDGLTLCVTGSSEGPNDVDVATIGYSDLGQQEWVTRYDSGEADAAPSIAASPLGGFFVATGKGGGSITTIAYDAGGGQLWLGYESWSVEGANPSDIAVTPAGDMVVVSGDVRDVYWQAGAFGYSTQ